MDRDLIYAIGGMENGGYTSTVEVYDPVQQVWSEVDSMSQARCNPGKYYIPKYLLIKGQKISEYFSCLQFLKNNQPKSCFPNFYPSL